MNKHDASTQTIDYPQEFLFVALKHSRSGPYCISYRGYNRTLLTSELSEREKQLMLCSICKGVLFEASNGAENILCSVCMPTDSIATPIAPFRKIINALPAHCPLCMRGCGWVGTLATIRSHVNRCDYLFTVCTLGCGELMLQKLITEHTENICMERYISCELCIQRIKVRELSEHLEICPNFIVSCKKCEEKLKRCHLETHLIELCKYRLVKCTYYKYGCRGEIKFCEMSQHMNNTKDVHITFLENAILEKDNQLKLKFKLEKANSLMKQLLSPNIISVRFPCEMYISGLSAGHKRVIDRGINIDFEGKSLKLILTQESNKRLYFALVFPSHCTGTFRTNLINQNNAQESILFEKARIICKPCIQYTELHSDDLETSEESKPQCDYYSLISTGLEGVLLQPPYLQGGCFELKLILFINFTESLNIRAFKL